MDGARTTFQSIRIPLPVWQLVHFVTSARGVKHVVSRCKQNKPHVFHKPFHPYFLVPSMLRCLGRFKTNSMDAKNVPPPKSICWSMYVSPTVSDQILTSWALRQSMVQCWRHKLLHAVFDGKRCPQKLWSQFTSKVQQNKQVKGQLQPAIDLWGSILV